jgi:hypothetical protein
MLTRRNWLSRTLSAAVAALLPWRAPVPVNGADYTDQLVPVDPREPVGVRRIENTGQCVQDLVVLTMNGGPAAALGQRVVLTTTTSWLYYVLADDRVGGPVLQDGQPVPGGRTEIDLQVDRLVLPAAIWAEWRQQSEVLRPGELRLSAAGGEFDVTLKHVVLTAVGCSVQSGEMLVLESVRFLACGLELTRVGGPHHTILYDPYLGERYPCDGEFVMYAWGGGGPSPSGSADAES